MSDSYNLNLSVAEQRKQLRTQLRKARNVLSGTEQKTATTEIASQVQQELKSANNVALYLANDGEISPELIIKALWQANKHVLLPVMHSLRKGYLNFQRYEKNMQLPLNQYGICEPNLDSTQTVALDDIDVILMPLVGFDDKGNRLGMGGGYYDRTLNRLNVMTHPPRLIGLAHDCQQVENLPIEGWDIPLDMIITPNQKIFVKDT